MKNDIYSMLNYIDINLENYKKESFNDIEKKNIKANFRKSIHKKRSPRKSIVAAGVVMALTGTLLGTNIGANALTNVLKIDGVEDIGSFLGIHKKLDEYKTVINKAITDNGITIKLNEVILDGNEITVSYNISSNEKLKDLESPAHTFGELYINDKKITYGDTSRSKKVDDYNAQQVISYDLLNEHLSGELDIKMKCSAIYIDGNKKEGHWNFEFKANGDELKADTKEIKLNNKIKLKNGDEYTLERYTDNSLGQRIYASVSNYTGKPRYYMDLRGTDDLGNHVTFFVPGRKNGVLFRMSKNLNEKAKTLTLTPYAAECSADDGSQLNFEQVGETFTIDLLQLKWWRPILVTK